jgi:hypothetical protein
MGCGRDGKVVHAVYRTVMGSPYAALFSSYSACSEREIVDREGKGCRGLPIYAGRCLG